VLEKLANVTGIHSSLYRALDESGNESDVGSCARRRRKGCETYVCSLSPARLYILGSESESTQELNSHSLFILNPFKQLHEKWLFIRTLPIGEYNSGHTTR
jgi:hypothetical protein